MSIDINALLDKKIEFPKTLDYFLYGGFLLGLLTFLYNLFSGHQDVAWTAFHLNFVFWAGVSHGGVLFACAMRITSSSWGRSLMRICESFAAFMPVVFILLLVLLFIDGEQTLLYLSEEYKNYDYITSRKHDIWLNFNSVFIRSVLLIGTLHILTYYYLYHSIKQDCEGTGRFKGFFSFLSSAPEEGKEVDHDDKLYTYSICIAFAYSLSMTFIAFDFIMSLDVHFYSTLFGVYYFMASVLAALGLVVIISSMMAIKFKLESVITEFQFYDAAKLMFGLSVFWLYTFFSQFLPIWYANMPEETGYIATRVFDEPYKSLAWVTLTCVFVIPFVTLIPRTTKIVKPILVSIATVSFLGLFVEKIVLIYPSIMHDHFHFGLESILISFGFMCLFLLCVTKFLAYFPIFGLKDKKLIKKLSSGGGHH